MVSALRPTPVKWCSVKLSEVVKNQKRLEADIFDIETRNYRSLVENSVNGVTFLAGKNGLIKNAFYPGRFKRTYCKKQYGIPFFLPSQLSEIHPQPTKWISKITKCDIEDLRLKRNTLLLSRSGTLGNISIVSRTTENQIYSDDVIRITFKFDYDLGYVYAYLKSTVGKKLLSATGYGSVITHIEPKHLETIPVPNAPEEVKRRIHGHIMRSYALRDESNELLDKAQALLREELNLKKLEDLKLDLLAENTGAQMYSVKQSRLGGRLDASYHTPLVKAILAEISKNAAELTNVGDSRISRDIILPGRFKRFYVDEGAGRVFIGGKQIQELAPENKKYLSVRQHGARIAAQLELHENMTVLTCSGTIGKVALVGRQWENWTASQHIIRIIPANDDIAGYLSVFLSSDYGRHLIAHHTYGSVVDEIDDNHVSQIQIPLLKNASVQKEINDCALQAKQKRYEAYRMEQEALGLLDDVFTE